MVSTMKALYRKYRSKKLSEVVGQEHVTSTLDQALKTGKISHAYLFTGPRGTGKTSTARILAKAINCLHPRDGNPCNECEMCRAAGPFQASRNMSFDIFRRIADELFPYAQIVDLRGW